MDSVSQVYDKPQMYGVPNKLYLCQYERQNEINDRISSRNIPSAPLQPFYYQVPVSTKYGYMPILDQSKPATVPLNNYPVYNPHTTFNPGNNMAPWSGFANNINVESTLRSQFFGLQDCEQSQYVPSSNSDLYDYTFKTKTQSNPHDLLFKQEHFSEFNPNPSTKIVGSGIFMNSTRVQVRDLTNQKC